MIEIGIEVNVKSSSKRTIFHSICENYRNEDLYEIVELMMKKRIYVNVKESNQKTPLHWLCLIYKNHNLLDIFQHLVDNADDILLDSKDSDGKTILHLRCAIYGNENMFDIVKLLIDYYDVHLNIVDLNRKTALHYLKENFTLGNLEDIVERLTGSNNPRVENQGQEAPHEHLQLRIDESIIDNNSKTFSFWSLFPRFSTQQLIILFQFIIIVIFAYVIYLLLCGNTTDKTM